MTLDSIRGSAIRRCPPRRLGESISVIAGPRFEPATEAPQANGSHGRPVDHSFSGHGARNSTPGLARSSRAKLRRLPRYSRGYLTGAYEVPLYKGEVPPRHRPIGVPLPL